MNNKEKTTVGVVVGRFHTPKLHEGHRILLNMVYENHSKMIVVLGISVVPTTASDPLDFEMRKHMISTKYPDAIIIGVKDQPTDDGWSKLLDERISEVVTPNQKIILYGGRDSFIPHYHGSYTTKEFDPLTYNSATNIRNEISNGSFSRIVEGMTPHEAFRAGVIWATQNRFPATHPTVDIAIFNEDESQILLVQKSNDSRWRLCGGFADPNSETFESDAKREVMEELHIEISNPVYRCSSKIDDWRYRRQPDKIKTLFFTAKHIFGFPQPDDDICHAKWFKLVDAATSNDIVPSHQKLIRNIVDVGKSE